MKNENGSLMRPDPLPNSASRPVVTPLSPSVVYASDTPDMLDRQYEGALHGYTYSREGHPNADVVAARLDRMENAPNAGIMTSSGMGAVATVLLGLCGAGDHLIGSNQLYGRSLRMMREDLPRLGVETTLVDACDIDEVRKAIRPNTRLILVEVVSNPTLRVADIDGLVGLARDAGVLLAIDNTFTTPRAFRALDAGADIVIHSVTKLLAGHSDVLLGYVSARDPEPSERLRLFSVTREGAAARTDRQHGELRDRRLAAGGQCLHARRVWPVLRADTGRCGHHDLASRHLLSSWPHRRTARRAGNVRRLLPHLRRP